MIEKKKKIPQIETIEGIQRNEEANSSDESLGKKRMKKILQIRNPFQTLK